jgi:hypothetical protein
MAIGLITHQDSTRAEDVVDLITNVAYKTTPFYSGLATSTATNTLHEWLTDTFATSADNAVVEASDATIVDHTVASRKNNVVQMFRKVLTVSDTERAVDVYGTGDPYTYQMQKAATELARDIEKALVAGTRASGASGTARRMNGVIALISTNVTARNSGTSLSETEFNDIMSGVWGSGTDQHPDEVYVGSYLKRVISGYTGGNTKFLQTNNDRRLINRTDVYEGDFGIHKIFLHREVPTAAGSAGLIAVDSAKWRVAYLNGRRPTHMPLAKTGSATKGMIEGELTLEALAEASSAYRSGYFVG